jgi:conjugal transfer mating pair stabilization protein TraN
VTVKYYDCCPSQGSLKKTVYIDDANKLLNGVSYQQCGNAKIICNQAGACSVYFQNYSCSSCSLIGTPYIANSFSITTREEYECSDGQYVGLDTYQGADPTKCYNGYVPSCNQGELNSNTDTCQLDYTYYNYLCEEGVNEYGNEFEAEEPGGDCNAENLLEDGTCNDAQPPEDNCKKEKYTCQESEDRTCALINGEYQCSPYPCYGQNDIKDTDTEVGLNDENNDGWDDIGNCIGQIYIYNGKDSRCRSDDELFGLTGGGCCDADKVFLGLIACEADEVKLAKQQTKGQTHYIGEYCSKELDLGLTTICIQHKKTYCAFNSKLARIIHEQGRPQLGMEWGTPKSPNCIGFTPEDFQKLDFSEIDMSEFFEDIESQMSTDLLNSTGDYLQNKVDTLLTNQ